MSIADYLANTIIRGRHLNNTYASLKPISLSCRATKPIISYKNVAKPIEVSDLGVPFNLCYLNEPGKVSFGIKDFAPGLYIPLHHHHTWEVVFIDFTSEGPGYIFFDNQWWRSDPGTIIFIPDEYSNSWSAGNRSFRMLWIYGGCLEEAGRVLDIDNRDNQAITPKEEAVASPPENWSSPDMLNWHVTEDSFWTE